MQSPVDFIKHFTVLKNDARVKKIKCILKGLIFILEQQTHCDEVASNEDQHLPAENFKINANITYKRTITKFSSIF